MSRRTSGFRIAIAFTLCWLSQTYCVAQSTRAVHADQSEVDQVLAKLGDPDSSTRDRASVILEELPDGDLPLIQAAARQEDLSFEVKNRLTRVLPRMEARTALHNRQFTKAVADYNAIFEQLRKGYDRTGHKDAKWDGPAHEAFVVAAKVGGSANRSETNAIIAHEQKLLDTAIDAGCDDPTILAMRGLVAIDRSRPTEEVFSWFDRAHKSIRDDKADPYTRLVIDAKLLRLGMPKGGGKLQTHEERTLQMIDMMHQYTFASELPGINLIVLKDMGTNVMSTAKACRFKLESPFKIVYPALEAAGANDVGVLLIKGRYYIDWAWEARGGGFANTVTEQGWKDFADRLQIANATLTHAWELDPTDPKPPTEMLTVALGMDAPDNVEKLWFDRAMTNNPDNKEACDARLYYLEPKWHGNAEAMLNFGHDCFKTGNWRGQLPFILIDAHDKLSRYAPDPNLYFRDETVWADINSVYAPYLDLNPENRQIRSRYAYFASLCGQWKVANAQFTELGENAVPTAFGGQAVMNDLRHRAAELGGGQPADK